VGYEMKLIFPRISSKSVKATSIFSLMIFTCLGAHSALAAPTDHFVTTWKTDNPGTSNSTSITVPMAGGPYDVDWDNDGTFDDLGLTGSVTHNYEVAGTYTIRIQGTYDSIRFNNGGDKEKILSLDQWGTNAWSSMGQAFYGALNLTIPATDTPDFSSVTDMAQMFQEATSANPDTSSWDTASVTFMAGMFNGATSANPNISGWDTSAVTNMASMFQATTSANPNTSSWNTSAVTDMKWMFKGALAANPDTSGWDTSSVLSMHSMFEEATSANPDTSGWDTSAVTDMSQMFMGATSANPNTSSWDTSSVADMSRMFRDATSANPDTTGWDVSAVTNMARMFQRSPANPDTSGWNTAAVTNMSLMFSEAASANPDTSGWDTASVTQMVAMFQFASSADPDTSGWNTSAVVFMTAMFSRATSANPNTSDWDTSAVVDMRWMFYEATSANPDTSGWNTAAVTNMLEMFFGATSANPDLSGWDTSAVTDMTRMFHLATSFDQDIGSWDVTSLLDATGMFSEVTLSTANYDSLLIGWNAQALQPGVVFSGGNSNYCSDAAVAARANMIAMHGWSITDGGPFCSDDHFVTTWKTDNPGTSNSTSITVPMIGGPYDVDWDNDGTFDDLGLTGSVTHNYEVAGTYTIRIQGTYDSIRFNNGGDKEKILFLDQWGTNSWMSMNHAFTGARNLQIPATDTPDFSAVTDMSWMFLGAQDANPDTSGWDTSAVTDMSAMFLGALSANPDTSGWDTSAVTDMSSMFQGAEFANPDTSGWDTSAATDMSFMFTGAFAANPDTSGWDTTAVTTMFEMFREARSANPNTSGWNTAAVTTMYAMFENATSASPDTSDWDTSAVTDMSLMFAGATSANPDTSGWDTSSVSNMSLMFSGATYFEQDIGSWDVTALIDAHGMFTDVSLTNAHYDSLLIGWNAQALQPGVFFSGGNSKYCSDAAIAARANMIASDGWVITDGGQACPPPNPTIAPDLTPETDTGDSNSDDLTANYTPDFYVMCSVNGNTITLYSDQPAPNSAIGTHMCTTVGTETASVTTPLSYGVHNITYTDKDGNGESGHSPPLAVSIDMIFPSSFEQRL
jgi:surface protein